MTFTKRSGSYKHSPLWGRYTVTRIESIQPDGSCEEAVCDRIPWAKAKDWKYLVWDSLENRAVRLPA